MHACNYPASNGPGTARKQRRQQRILGTSAAERSVGIMGAPKESMLPVTRMPQLVEQGRSLAQSVMWRSIFMLRYACISCGVALADAVAATADITILEEIENLDEEATRRFHKNAVDEQDVQEWGQRSLCYPYLTRRNIAAPHDKLRLLYLLQFVPIRESGHRSIQPCDVSCCRAAYTSWFGCIKP